MCFHGWKCTSSVPSELEVLESRSPTMAGVSGIILCFFSHDFGIMCWVFLLAITLYYE